jgi:hypothetical protein
MPPPPRRHRQRFRILWAKVRHKLTIAALILSVLGVITFSQFILEESFQTVMFGTWQLKDTGQWSLYLEGIDLMDDINSSLKAVTYSVGWLQPFGFISYHHYARSADFYIKGLKSMVFAKSPEAFENRKVKFEFVPERVEIDGDHIRLINRKIIVIGKGEASLQPVIVVGRVSVVNANIVIDSDSILPVRRQNLNSQGGTNQ